MAGTLPVEASCWVGSNMQLVNVGETKNNACKTKGEAGLPRVCF